MNSSVNPSKILLKLLNFLADFDGELSADAAIVLHQLRHQVEQIPPLYADVFGLPAASTCADLVNRVETLSSQQRAVASYAFQIFRSYEQLLRVETAQSPEQQAANESQLEQVRLRVARTKQVLAEILGDVS